MPCTIPLKQTNQSHPQLEVVVDEVDFEWASHFSWYAWQTPGGWYAARRTRIGKRKEGKVQIILLHRQILGLQPGDGKKVDHQNGNKLDCRRCNLRLANSQQNSANSGLQKNNTSGYKGVHWRRGQWHAQICVNGQIIRLGRFVDAEEAARAYNTAAQKHFGEFAWLNPV